VFLKLNSYVTANDLNNLSVRIQQQNLLRKHDVRSMWLF